MRKLFQTNKIVGSSLPSRFIAKYLLKLEVLPVGVPPGYTRRWIQGVPTPLPAWEGVTPGQTTVEKAIKIWNDNPAIIKGSVVAHPHPETNTGNVVWKWVSSERGGEALYKLDVLPYTICLIRPFFEHIPGADDTFKLEEVMQAYGEPSHVRATTFFGRHGDGPFYTLEIYYAERGINFRQRGLYRRVPKLEPKMSFNSVCFNSLPYEPDDYNVVWQGFKNFEEYYFKEKYR